MHFNNPNRHSLRTQQVIRVNEESARLLSTMYQRMIRGGIARQVLQQQQQQRLCLSSLGAFPPSRNWPCSLLLRKKRGGNCLDDHRRSFSYLWDVVQSGNIFASNPILELIRDDSAVQGVSKRTPADLSTMTTSYLTRAATQVQTQYEEAWKGLKPKINDLSPEELLEHLDQLEASSLVVNNVADLCHQMHAFNDSWIRAVQNVKGSTHFEHEESRELYSALVHASANVDSGTMADRLIRTKLRNFKNRGIHLDDEAHGTFSDLQDSILQLESEFLTREEGGSVTKRQLQCMYGFFSMRQKQAELLGYDTCVDLAFDDRSISDCNKIRRLHDEVARRASLSLESVEHDANEIDLTPYLSLDGTLQGLFAIARALFGIVITEDKNPNGWHQDVRMFHIATEDDNERLIGSFYIDAYKRSTKTNSPYVVPLTPEIVYMNANVTAPVWDDSPSPVCLEVVVAIFHEFGHVLQYLLARDHSWYNSDSGSFDISEVIPQFMEHWVFEESILQTLAHLSGSDSPIPEEMVLSIQKQRRNEKVEESLRRVFLGELEFELFSRKDNEESLIAMQRRLGEIYVPHELPPKSDLSPLFQLMEANGLRQKPVAQYRYLLSELISADLFEKFKEAGISNQDEMKKLGDVFKSLIIEAGPHVDIKQVLRSLCGHECVSPDAYFKLYNM